MRYELRFRPSALRDLRKLPKDVSRRVLAKLERMQEDLQGDVMRLSGDELGFRLRAGDYRALFDIEDNRIVVRRVGHRRDIYGKQNR